ncbi:TIGR03089 family protein [Raineyella fluvialis]|nr:TIGR03089 family protein [Raineyella fluvialis]
MRTAGSLSLDHCLRDRVRHRGGDPLVTYYAPSSGVRIELSARTFANWVDKTANLIVDDLDVTEGDVAVLPLVTDHPGHWSSLVWIAALWQVGVLVRDPRQADGAPDLVVTGPEEYDDDFAGARALAARATVACALHPLGLGFPRPVAPGVVDYGAEVLSQPDVYVQAPASPGAPLWQAAGSSLDWAAVRGDAERLLADPSVGDVTYGRRLVRPGEAYATVLAALVAPLLGDGSVVVVDGPVDEAALAGIAAAERITA